MGPQWDREERCYTPGPGDQCWSNIMMVISIKMGRRLWQNIKHRWWGKPRPFHGVQPKGWRTQGTRRSAGEGDIFGHNIHENSKIWCFSFALKSRRRPKTVKVLILRKKVLKDLSGICVCRSPGCEKLIWRLGEGGRRFMKSSTTVTTAQNARWDLLQFTFKVQNIIQEQKDLHHLKTGRDNTW